ncbi:MAG: prepilin-type N-terminal cleavage/methylation domain-containing protein [Acidimicrobiales bacterium]
MKRFRRSRCGSDSDKGFTLIELLIVTTIMPLIVGALSAGLLAVFSLQSSVSSRLSDSSDSQVVAANYVQDVQAAQQITTQATPSCGPASQTQLLGLEWDDVSGTYQTVVSYVEVAAGTKYNLIREYCSAGASTTASLASIVVYDMPKWVSGNPSLLTILPAASATAAAAGWTSAQPVTGVTFSITEPGSGTTGGAPYAYTLVAVPAAGAPLGQQGTPTQTTTGCGFALAGTGTYASTLCFVDFTPLNIAANQISATAPGAMQMTVAIPGGYVMSFSISITNETGTGAELVDAYQFPTYDDAFMGNANNGTPFYSGVGCAAGTNPLTGSNGTPSCILPALYQQSNAATNTITIGNIEVTDPEGNNATGWQIVTGDAETTDPNEYLTWTSNQDLNLIPNNQNAPGGNNEGNACNEGNDGPGGTDLTGLGTTSVTCRSTWQDSGTPRTGAVMLETAQPTTVTASMQGAGLEGVFFGILLPS